jgi:hypothetical protein
VKVKVWEAESITTRCTSFFCTCFTNSEKATYNREAYNRRAGQKKNA